MRQKLTGTFLFIWVAIGAVSAQTTESGAGGSQVSAAQARGNQSPVIQGNWKELLAGPEKRTDYKAWRNAMIDWRRNMRDSIQYTAINYHRKGLGWIESSYIQTQMMVEDRYFYDPVQGRYTVERYLNDLKKRYGGIDAVLIWPTYPNIGIDGRNQFDMLADMPGGIEGVRRMVADFKRHGVRVFFPIMPWDNGTRKPGTSIAREITREMAAVGADGLNGDTMNGIGDDFFWAVKDSVRYPLALEPEINMQDLAMLKWNTMSWAYYDDYTYVPGVSLYKWLETLHMPVVNNRWAFDKTSDLQYAFFNGIGYTAWENIWGIWNGIAPRYAETLRRISLIYRHYPILFHSPGWEPHTPVLQDSVFASKFPGSSETIWTFVNRGSHPVTGPQIRLPYQAGVRYFDLWNGARLTPDRQKDSVTLSMPIDGNGFGAILGVAKASEKEPGELLVTVRQMARIPLDSLPAEWTFLGQKMVPIASTLSESPKSTTGMVLIPAAKLFSFDVSGIMIEGDDIPKGVDIQYPWEDMAGRSHHHFMDIPSFYIDQYPVTNAQFKAFLDASGYEPRDKHNFLRYWQGNNYPQGEGAVPVTYVSIEDARAYARWAGKRLPHEWEWQYAAQGMDKRIYPWGNNADSSRIPPVDSSRTMRRPTAVTAYPQGASPFGVMDLVGNVWQWTDEYVDDHIRAAIIRGGSYFYATTSNWYFPETHKLNEHGKYLLMSPGRDRAATIGFRCAADLPRGKFLDDRK